MKRWVVEGMIPFRIEVEAEHWQGAAGEASRRIDLKHLTTSKLVSCRFSEAADKERV